MNWFQKTAMVLFSLMVVVCLGIDAFYIYTYFTQPEKIISQTYEVGAQTITKADGTTESRNFVELNYFTNSNGSGYEVFEIKFNYMMDENQNAFYSQGIQYFVTSEDKKLDFRNRNYDYYYISPNTVKEEHYTVSHSYFYDAWLETSSYKNMGVINYMSDDDYKTTLISTNPITIDTSFKIQLGNDLYCMKFKGMDENRKLDLYKGLSCVEDKSEFCIMAKYFWLPTFHQLTTYYNNYQCIDLSYFSEILYNSIQTVSYGTSAEFVFEFGDLFDYYAFDEASNTYAKTTVSSDKYAKIVADLKSYYSIKVNIHEDGLKSSKDSLFNCFNGNTSYETEVTFDDYAFGKTILNVSTGNFGYEVVDEENKTYNLKLSQAFLANYDKYKDNTILQITVNLDTLKGMDINFVGFTEDAFGEFEIYKIYIIEDGVKTEYGGGVC